jgi:hypothetical protein
MASATEVTKPFVHCRQQEADMKNDQARQLIEQELKNGVIRIRQHPNSTELLLHRLYLTLSIGLLVAPFLL